ncbi:MAG: cyclic nucleotide-binding domain-containing protein [Dehalococcoidia bacterium]
MNLAQVLRRCEVFVGLDDSDLEKIASLPSWQRNTYGTGESVFRENDVAKDFYILEEGEVRLVVASRKGRGTKEPVRVSVDTITKGDVFGWSSLVTPHSRNMSAICVRPSTILSITGTELNHLMDHNDSLGYEVMKSLVRVIGKRLRELQNKFAGE